MKDSENKHELKPASENIWYVLSTIAGEPENLSDPIVEKNAHYWNGIMRSRLSDKEYGELKDKDGKQIVLPELTDEEWECIAKSLEARGFSKVNVPAAQKSINFTKIEFPNITIYNKFVFTGYADFSDATFTGIADFSDATFTGIADFRDATFTRGAYFRGATFTGIAYFRDATFMGYANFIKAKFGRRINYNSTVFKTTTDFTEAKFCKHPPEFYDAKISESIIWTDTEFPNPPGERNEAVAHKNAYERLSLMMSKLEKTHDQHMFFRNEMRARRALDKHWASRAMNWIYDKTCDYGYGFGRALSLWIAHIFIGAGLLLIPAPHNWAGIVNAVATSFANAHSFLGLNRGPLKTVYAEYAEWDFFNVIWTVQALFGILFLFFLLLTIRNRFKMG